LQAGMVGINTGVVSNPAAPFGGIKQSGLGREGGLSGIEEFVETKLTAIPARGLAPAAAPRDLPLGCRYALRPRHATGNRRGGSHGARGRTARGAQAGGGAVAQAPVAPGPPSTRESPSRMCSTSRVLAGSGSASRTASAIARCSASRDRASV